MDQTIVVRNLTFDVKGDVPKYWHGGQRAVTTFFDNLSIFFPAGERFFIASVRAHADCVRGSRLLEDVRAFLGQEGVHRREHARYNDRLQSHGYPVDILEKRVERLLGRAEKRLSLRAQLAVTCALEHLTALMGHMLLGDPRVLEGAHPTMAALWRWHAAEENEHKCVAYEVYLRAGGTYRERTLVMLLVSTVFWIRVIEHQICLTRRNGTLFCAGEWWSLFAFLFVKPGAMRGVVKLYFHYFRPRFHPRDIDSRALVDGWRQTLTSEAAPNTLTLRQP